MHSDAILITSNIGYSPKGHIFCKECIYESLLTQKKEIKKKLKQWEEQQKLLQAQQAEKEREKQEEELLKFAKAETSVIGAEAIKETDKKDPSRSNKLTAFWLVRLITNYIHTLHQCVNQTATIASVNPERRAINWGKAFKGY